MHRMNSHVGCTYQLLLGPCVPVGPRRLPTHSIKVPLLVGSSRQVPHLRQTLSSSKHDEFSAGVSFASLPISTQSLSMAFQILDKDDDGRINRSEACRLVAYYLALQQHKPASAQRRPLTWDQHLLASISTASKLSQGSWVGVASACEAFVGAKAAGGLQAHPPRCSDLLWGALGMATAVLALGVLAAAAKALPVVGQWHQQGVPLLLGSFGTLAIFLFGKPEAEPVRLWPIVAGQLGATAIVIAVLQVWGPSLVSRAAAMAATVAWMMWSDCIHPPAGALVLMAMDNIAIQAMSWHYLLWPSLALSLGVLLPISAATNWLRRNYQFDAPWSTAGASSLQQKVQEWQQQQAAKQAAVLRQYRALEIDRGLDGQQALHEELHSPFARLGRMLQPVLQLLPVRKLANAAPKPQRWGMLAVYQQQLRVHGFNLDLGTLNLGGSITDAGPAEAAAAAALDAAIRQRLSLEQERRLEDSEHRKRMWGGPAQVPGVAKFEAQIDELHRQRMQQQGQGQLGEGAQEGLHHQPTGKNTDQQQQEVAELQAQQRSPEPSAKQQPQQQSQPLLQQPPQQHHQQQQPIERVMSPRQRLEEHWGLAAQLHDAGSSSSGGRFRGDKFGGSGHQGGTQGMLDSFAPDEE